ncbi:hypothetical protein [Hydrogenophaga sp. OTU3427]|uniref:hypothetical protein n=1 Tax=Hydrogenophaga sp. OTU3427 TaxID=3043856 RepID=UPI00313D9A3F
MVSTTLGYDKREDRVWLSFDDGTPRLWFTRRLVSHLLGPMLRPFEASAPGGQGGAGAAIRVALEHELAMNEPLPGEVAPPMKMGLEAPDASPDADDQLCTGLNAAFDAGQCRISFHTREGERVLQMGRVGMHRWLRGLHLLVRHAEWELLAPEWLTRSCLPEAMRSLVQGAASLPPDANPGH